VALASMRRDRFASSRISLSGPENIKAEWTWLVRWIRRMDIESFHSFLDYFEKVRERTLRVARCIPADRIDWTYKEGKFTFADILRHIAAIERFMYAENAQFKPSRYAGHGKELGQGLGPVMEFMSRSHHESMEIFRALAATDLNRKCITPGGASITLWKWLRAMAEHEIHHRGQIYLYLAIAGVPTPPLYGLTSEEVAARSE
jgi:uncharacterized damage-inducible protein DinB